MLRKMILAVAVLTQLSGMVAAQSANTDSTAVPALNPGYTALSVTSLNGSPIKCPSPMGAGATLVFARTQSDYNSLFTGSQCYKQWNAQSAWSGVGWYCATKHNPICTGGET